jgi:hypothetical protein
MNELASQECSGRVASCSEQTWRKGWSQMVATASPFLLQYGLVPGRPWLPALSYGVLREKVTIDCAAAGQFDLLIMPKVKCLLWRRQDFKWLRMRIEAVIETKISWRSSSSPEHSWPGVLGPAARSCSYGFILPLILLLCSMRCDSLLAHRSPALSSIPWSRVRGPPLQLWPCIGVFNGGCTKQMCRTFGYILEQPHGKSIKSRTHG